ncbi:MAG: carboxylating nicotinate-nucleotide diphosphorylase [Candidatus Cloacimonetes bacterium]|jgi:nicotinate-nucleotide pyrophosphorylase (carboxylating)|nr:carboxylating nicotinate-nucleotide diphosphorylase [Candidatus Cloacimonadota bacterium]MDD2505886.1 carboxylating nicotinate-nucleotide diphosphorylase [Candidatus Cloacimonadota bacterium]MDD4560148.1 carboxylating nicotinate-nucleotide diphosphorylase [Candidatus Cloacimonadota bacterium]
MLIDEIIRKSLEEDLGSGDITTRYLDLDPAICSAYMIAKADGILAGTDIAKEVFKAVDPELKITLYRKDGDMVHPKDEIMRVEGKPSSILQAERTALNFLQRLSGIASQTRRMVDAIAGTNTKLLDTRKTTPLLRSLEKYAVRVGGGLNHRHGLYDMIMLKENHIRAAGGISKAIQKIQTQNASYKLEVEVTNLQELEEAVAAKADRVMLDNMGIKEIKAAVKRFGEKVELEISGGVNEDNILQYARTGVHYISSGALTHSYKSLDISLLFKE